MVCFRTGKIHSTLVRLDRSMFTKEAEERTYQVIMSHASTQNQQVCLCGRIETNLSAGRRKSSPFIQTRFPVNQTFIILSLLWFLPMSTSFTIHTPFHSKTPVRLKRPLAVADDTYMTSTLDSSEYQKSSRKPFRTLNETYNFWQDQVSVASFNMDLQNLACDDPLLAQDALEIMIDLHNKYPNSSATVQPDASCYNTVMEGWIFAGKLEQAHAVLEQMLATSSKCHNATITSVVEPTEWTYIQLAQAWADENIKGDIVGRTAGRAEAILRFVQSRKLPASVKLYSIVIEAWCKRAGVCRGALRRAETLLAEMEAAAAAVSNQNNTKTVYSCLEQSGSEPDTSNQLSRLGQDWTVRPNVLTYTSYIGGLARSGEKDCATRAEAVLDRMQTHGVVPDMVAYTSVLNCWAKAVNRREREVAASRALRLIGEMERLYIKGDHSVKPSLITYATAISALGNSLDPAAPRLVEEMLKRMYELHDSGVITNIKPTTATYNAVIYAISKAPVPNRLKYAKRAEQILNEMMERSRQGEKDVQPDVRTWAAVLRTWARSGQIDAAENAQRVLDQLEASYKSGETKVRPNFVCYTTVMGAWGQSRRRGALEKMENILRHMENMYEQTQEADIRPNTVSYVTAIDSYVRRNEKDAAQRAQATVDRMLQLYAKGLGHVRPTKIVFNTLIHAWSKSKEPGAAQKAEKIFKWMEAQYRSGDDLVQPDAVSLCAVLNAWANQAENGGAERALQIWKHTRSIPLEKRGFELSIMMPNIVIKALARSKDPDAALKTESILLQLEDEYRSGKGCLRPDVTTYSSVINSCAYYSGTPTGREKALQIALRTFHKLVDLEDESPNNITYGTLFKAIANLMPVGEEREKLVRSQFDQCCDRGLVDAFVLSQVRSACPELYRELVDEPCGLAGPDADDRIESILENIPEEWSANVVFD